MVLGPGTGLGVGALIKAGGLWVPVPGEGGHVALGPDEPDEFPLWENIELEHGRISAETLLCRARAGAALPRAWRSREGATRDPRRRRRSPGPRSPARTPTAVRTVSLYCRAARPLAGDMALVFMARGGVYIGGGIPPRILPFMSSGEFRRAFEAKAPHEDAHGRNPDLGHLAREPGAAGLAAFARTPERFGVNLAGRHWSR